MTALRARDKLQSSPAAACAATAEISAATETTKAAAARTASASAKASPAPAARSRSSATVQQRANQEPGEKAASASATAAASKNSQQDHHHHDSAGDKHKDQRPRRSILRPGPALGNAGRARGKNLVGAEALLLRDCRNVCIDCVSQILRILSSLERGDETLALNLSDQPIRKFSLQMPAYLRKVFPIFDRLHSSSRLGFWVSFAPIPHPRATPASNRKRPGRRWCRPSPLRTVSAAADPDCRAWSQAALSCCYRQPSQSRSRSRSAAAVGIAQSVRSPGPHRDRSRTNAATGISKTRVLDILCAD